MERIRTVAKLKAGDVIRFDTPNARYDVISSIACTSPGWNNYVNLTVRDRLTSEVTTRRFARNFAVELMFR